LARSAIKTVIWIPQVTPKSDVNAYSFSPVTFESAAELCSTTCPHRSTMSAPQANEAEKNIEIWKVKKLIKRLEAARGNGTSMISLIIRMSAVS